MQLISSEFYHLKSLPRQFFNIFVGGGRLELSEMFNFDTLEETLESQNTSWIFIPKPAPWCRGFWKTKQVVKKTLGKAFITQNQLETVIVKNEVMLNYIRMCLQIFVEAS